ncbi:MAG: hypothetical protein WEA81_01190, partial [Dehalococcoidia bacterium]
MTPRLLRTSLTALVFAAAIAVATGTAMAPTTPAWVDTGGDCLWLRTAPGLESTNIVCMEHGTQLVLLAGSEPLDGFTWQQVEFDGQMGWVADFYITTDPDEVQPL